MRFLFRWMFKQELLEEYCRGVKDGVNQQYYEPETALWMIEEE